MTSVQCLSLIKLHYKLHAPTRRLVDIIVRDKPRIQLSNILNYVILTTGLSLVLRAYNRHEPVGDIRDFDISVQTML